jgi:hypothetical protein
MINRDRHSLPIKPGGKKKWTHTTQVLQWMKKTVSLNGQIEDLKSMATEHSLPPLQYPLP